MSEVELYLEAHVTIEPVFDRDRTRAAAVASEYGFRLADLLMKKSRSETEKRSNKDTFMTGHSKSCDDIYLRTKNLIWDLQANGFKVWRYKIENTLLDSRSADVWGLVADSPVLPFSMCDQCRR